ncbi:MAG: hypothetical protein H6824_09290 [Planctomycetaceae bacterium]|nr:hypothetical protein [Planctomycetaceae bacterium]
MESPKSCCTAHFPVTKRKKKKTWQRATCRCRYTSENSGTQRQIKQGWRWQDLQKYGSEFRLDKGPISLPSLEHIEGASVDALGDMLGKTRIVVLYRSTGRGLESGRTHAVVQRLVAVRVLHVRKNNSSLEMTVQPTVMATRTALADDTTGSALLANPYIYRLSLTY